MKTLAERIKDLPKGTKLYSLCYGEVTFQGIVTPNHIACESEHYTHTFFCNGSVHVHGECMLFPSKEYRDWDKFLAGRNKFDVRTLQPFDKVLVRDKDREVWDADFFSYYQVGEGTFLCVNSCRYQCIPYNDDTKHLLGHCKQAPEYYITWKEE